VSTIYLALGTNLGDRAANLRAAITGLAPDVQVLARSSVYETPPWGYTDQPSFLNMVLRAETSLDPHALLAYVKALETRLGREASFRYGPRKIDIDILFYDDRLLNQPVLQIPHPRLHERAFVLVPLAELAPDLVHPLLKERIQDLLSHVDAKVIQKTDITLADG